MAVALAQAVVQQAGTSATPSVTLGANPTIGNLLILAVSCGRTVAQVSATPPTTLGGAYTFIDGIDQGTSSVTIWGRIVTGASEALSQATTGAAVTETLTIFDLSGADPGGLAAATPSHSSNAVASAATATHTAITPTAGLSGVLIAGIMWGTGVTSAQSVNTGMTAHIGSTNRGAAAELVVASASGSYGPAWSWTTARPSALAQVFVQAASGGPPADTTSMFMAWHASMRG